MYFHNGLRTLDLTIRFKYYIFNYFQNYNQIMLIVISNAADLVVYAFLRSTLQINVAVLKLQQSFTDTKKLHSIIIQ